MKKRTKVIVVAIPVLIVLLLIGYLVSDYILQSNIDRVRQEAAYAQRLRVIDGKEDVSMMDTAEYYIPVQVGDKTIYYDTATAYINWRNYCSETNDENMTYETFVQSLLGPEETKETRAIMRWVENMSGTANTLSMLGSFSYYLGNPEVLNHPEQDWPDIVYACNLEQLEILYDYHVEQRGW